MTDSSYVFNPMPIVARCWWGIVKPTEIGILVASFVCLVAPGTVLAQQQVFYIEDWDTTPETPDELRGWRDNTGLKGTLDFEEGQGNYIRSNPLLVNPFFFTTFATPDSDDWPVNAYLGDKNYREMGISRIEFEARHDESFTIQADYTYMTLTLKTATEVDDPEGPGGTSRPIIWTHSENVVELNQGWESFGMNIPYDATSPPDGWYVYPDTVENWNLVMEDVDAVSVCFCAFQPGIGGVQMSWNVGLDNFTVYQGDPIGAQPVPSLGRAGILMLITMMGILAVVMLRSSRQ